MKHSHSRIRTVVATNTALTALFVLSACGKPEPPPPPPPVKETVFGDMVATKDKVKNDTQKAFDANQKKLEESMKKQEQEAAP